MYDIELQATDVHNPESTYYLKTGLQFWSLNTFEMGIYVAVRKSCVGGWEGDSRIGNVSAEPALWVSAMNAKASFPESAYI